jgi:glycosyltransferase involved in cell wall biosynthesis
MGKKSNNHQYPLVSLCTPTFNRRPFIETMLKCVENQLYPRNRMEWIIVDDGTDKIEDLIKHAKNVPQIHYYKIDQKMTLGAKRNLCHSKCKGDYIVYIDDDDYYPPERVSHAIETLQNNKNALCAGSSEIYVYFKHIQTMYKGGPYGPNHATAGTFAFRKELLKQTKYNENASLAEEREFLKNYTVPFVQLDPFKTILVFSHIHNTFDKRRLITDNNKTFTKSDRKVEEFIKNESEKMIYEFFMEKVEQYLQQYKPGDPIMKPDVLKQIEVLDKQRAELTENNMRIMVNENGTERPLSMKEIVVLIQKQQQEIASLKEKTTVMENQEKKIRVLESLLERMKNPNRIETVETGIQTKPCDPPTSIIYQQPSPEPPSLPPPPPPPLPKIPLCYLDKSYPEVMVEIAEG